MENCSIGWNVADDRSNLVNRNRVRAWCPECGDRLYTVYYINPRSASQHVAKTDFLVCRACPRFFAVSITELPLHILPREDRRRMGIFHYQSREELARIQEMGNERARGLRDQKGRFIEVQALAE